MTFNTQNIQISYEINSKYYFLVNLALLITLHKVFWGLLPKKSTLSQKISFLNFHYYVPELPGFQKWLILCLLGMAFHARVVSGLFFTFHLHPRERTV